jgi:hyperosmotically inducible periplasmic protein
MMNRPVVHPHAAPRGSSPEDDPILQQQPIREAISDGVITARVRSELLAYAITAGHDIHVNTIGGIVELSGFVETTTIAAAAVLIAQNVEGVQDVNDMIDVRTVD